MLLSKEEEENLSDEDFDKLMDGFEEDLDRYIKDMLENYLAYYIVTGYKMSAISENKLEVLSRTAITLLNGSREKLYDLNVVKKKLEKNYGLKITDDDRTAIEEI